MKVYYHRATQSEKMYMIHRYQPDTDTQILRLAYH